MVGSGGICGSYGAVLDTGGVCVCWVWAPVGGAAGSLLVGVDADLMADVTGTAKSPPMWPATWKLCKSCTWETEIDVMYTVMDSSSTCAFRNAMIV